MPGVIEFPRPDGTTIKYCLVPQVEPQGPRREYLPGLPITASPRLTPDRSQFKDPFGNVVPHAVPIFEQDFWAPSKTLYTMQGWLCYPLNFGLFRRLPFSVIELLIAKIKTEWQSLRLQGTFQLDWAGLTITRTYEVDELPFGVAIWPRRALPDWKQFFVLFAPGGKEDEKMTPFAAMQPTVYASVGGTLVRGDTEVLRAGNAAMCRSYDAPRLFAMRKEGEEEPIHGVMPLVCDGVGTFSIPGAPKDVRLPIIESLRLPQVSVDGTTVAQVSVDFGTTNTAVAAALPGHVGQVLQFSDEIRALKLTPAARDPAFELSARFGFFPMNVTPSNPLSTILVEAASGVEPFKGLSSLPRRTIPGDRLDDGVINPWIRTKIIKQEFKWQKDDNGAKLRAAFLEMLARFVGWELRTRPEYQHARKVQLVFTCPLSFTQEQTQSLLRAQLVFRQTLAECGFEVTLRGGLVSESLANLYLIRSARAGIGRALPEERHVVVDIGGGSTDISVFTGEGDPLFLDSLYLGGKDFSEVLLAEQLLSESNGAQYKSAVEKIFARDVRDVSGDDLGPLLQLLLVLRLERGIEAVASNFAESALKGTPADLLALLTFATVYGVRTAALGGIINGKTIPAANDIRVWFMGLGSRLFELSPVARAMTNRQGTARKVLEDSCRSVVGPNIQLQFTWGRATEAKLSVCRGALLVPPDEPALDLKTVFWADFGSANPAIAWSEEYDRAKLGSIDNAARRGLSTAELQRCATAAIDAVKKTLGFDADGSRLKLLASALQEDYSRGVADIAQGKPGAPQHPVSMATDGLKQNMVGLLGPRGR